MLILERDQRTDQIEELINERDQSNSQIEELINERDQSNSQIEMLINERDQSKNRIEMLSNERDQIKNRMDEREALIARILRKPWVRLGLRMGLMKRPFELKNDRSAEGKDSGGPG